MINTIHEARHALQDVSEFITTAYTEGYEAGQANLLHSLKAYFPDMTCVADISLRIEALQDEVKRGNT
jgi:hypothetical protein